MQVPACDSEQDLIVMLMVHENRVLVDTIKVRKLTGLLYRRFYRYSSTSTLTKLYVTYIRPLFEYAAAVWDPYLIKDINLLEKTQICAKSLCQELVPLA